MRDMSGHSRHVNWQMEWSEKGVVKGSLQRVLNSCRLGGAMLMPLLQAEAPGGDPEAEAGAGVPAKHQQGRPAGVRPHQEGAREDQVSPHRTAVAYSPRKAHLAQDCIIATGPCCLRNPASVWLQHTCCNFGISGRCQACRQPPVQQSACEQECCCHAGRSLRRWRRS